MRHSSLWRFDSGKPDRGSAKEPCYSLQELSDKISIPKSALVGLMRRYPGLEAWIPAGFQRHRIIRYRMTEFKRWWETVPQEAKLKLEKKYGKQDRRL